MKRLRKCLWVFACCLTSAICAETTHPNVIVILADDLGYADLGCQGSKDILTPHIDSLAQNGVRFTNGYVSSPQCGPSRAGLLTGRYQNRFGFESNEFAGKSIPRAEKLISERMKEAGYVTGYVGKWGVGNKQASGLEFIPPQRGFDESYWNSGGNFHFSATPGGHDVQFYRGNEMVEQPHYSTDAIGREAVEFVKRNRDKPFFLFVSHVTPHVPMQAKKEDLARFSDVEDPLRRTLLAMMACLDDNTGHLLNALKEEGLEENTLIIFLSDNGGPTKSNASLNTPFRGGKSDILEGGIRIPFLIQWKGKIPAGTVYEKPIISLDILPTTLAASGVEIKPEWKLDGVNLLPFLSGEKTEAPHDTLYWRFNRLTDQPENNCWAIRQADWMLLSNHVGRFADSLYDLSKDPEQKINLADAHPERVSEMRKQWETWNSGHPELSKSHRENRLESPRINKQTSKKEAPPADSKFQIAEIFSSDMILQREVQVPVWGRAPDGTVVTISFQGNEFATTSEKGQWRVNLPAMSASSKPVDMTVSAHLPSGVETRRFTNILVGDVWFVSGQSNMAMQLSEAAGGGEAVAESNNPHLRHFIVPRPDTPAAKTVNGWKFSNPETTQSQSAVGYFFASELQKKLGIPIGLINSSYGGTVTETWCPPDVMKKNWPAWEAGRLQALKNPETPIRNKQASYLYERMVQPLTSFPVKGFLWYQGEGNASRAEEQKQLLPAMIQGWRRAWGNERLPFFFVQLARYEVADWHAFRCAQLDVWKNTPDTHMAVTIDLSKEPGNHPIHPKAKKPIGHRLALAARAKVYGETDLIHSGPIVREAKISDGAVVLSFDHIGGGLTTPDRKPVRGFFVCADGEEFTATDAVIQGETVVIRIPDVPQPIAVRYGAEADMGKKELDLNLANQEMLPASPFTVSIQPVSKATSKTDSKPNVILILADDLGYGELGCYGGPVKTPHMDRLAAEGVRCTDGYAAFPVCSPSRAAILTGRYPQRFGPTYEDYFGHGSPELDPVKHVTIGQLMKESGYRTGCFGKWNVSNMDRTPANAFGFDTWVGLHLNHDFYTHKLVANGEHDLFKDGKPFDRKGVWSDTIFADEAIQFIKEESDKPFFIFLPFQAPHDPMQDPNQPFAERLSTKDPKNRPILVKMIERMDTEIGRVLQALDEEKLADNTLVILTSDNGGTPILGRNLPLNGAKQELLEGGVRVPLILRWPAALPKGKEFTTPVTAMDLTATIAATGGAKPRSDKPFDGVDLVPALTGKAELPADRPIFFRRRIIAVSKGENAIRQSAVRKGNWKLLRTYKPLGSDRYQIALYHLKDDLGEKTNLADSHPEQVKTLGKLLDHWEMEAARTAVPRGK